MASPVQLLSQCSTAISKADSVKQGRENETSQDRELITGIFKRLQSACPAWRQSLAGLPVEEAQELLRQTKRDWLNTFMGHGINDMRLIDYAFTRLLASSNPFMPTVGQFIAWCNEGKVPEGTKTPLEAYKEISQYQCLPREKRQPWGLSPEVYHTLYNLGDHVSWRVMNKQEHKKYWDDEYKVTLQTLRDGGPLHQARQPTAHIENKRTPLDKPKAISALQAMRDQLK